MREQNPDSYKDWSQLQNAFPFPARRVLHAERVGRAWYAVHGTRVDSTGKLTMVVKGYIMITNITVYVENLLYIIE